MDYKRFRLQNHNDTVKHKLSNNRFFFTLASLIDK